MARLRFRSPAAQPAAPRTAVGQFMASTLDGDMARSQYLRTRLQSGPGGVLHPGDVAFMEVAAELTALRYLGADYDVREVTALVAQGKAAVAGSSTEFGHLEAEAVFRVALGEEDVDLTGITRKDLYTLRTYLIILVALKQAWSEAEIRELIVQAEDAAFDRGAEPPLAR